MQKSFFWALVALSFSLSFAACKGNDPQPQTAQVQLQPEGGMFTLNNGVTIVVPEGAVTMPTDVQVEYLTDLDETVGNLPSDIQGRLKLTPEGLTFNKAIEVTMPLNQSVTDATLDIVYWSAQDKTWYITDRGQVANDKVTFYIEHFSDYASISSTFDPLFATMDHYVSTSATSGDITTDSPEMVNFLEEVLWEQKNFKNLVIATHADVGGQLVSVCAQCCGLFGSWMSKDTLTSEVRQSTGRFKEDSKDNIYTTLGLHESQMTEHLRNQIVTEARSTVIDRSIEIRYNACPVNLRGAASPTRIEKGKTTQVTITAHCNGDPLPDQLIQFSYSPELSCEVVNKKTDANGQVTITVKGEAEGNGIVYAKAVSAAHSDDVTEIQVPVKVGGGSVWEVEWELPVTETATLTNPDKYGYLPQLGIQNYVYSGTTQTISYTIVGTARIDTKNKRYEGNVRIKEGSVQYNFPNWESSWDDYDSDDRLFEKVNSYRYIYDCRYETDAIEQCTSESEVSSGRAYIYFSEYGETPILKDYSTYTWSKTGISYSYNGSDVSTRDWTENGEGKLNEGKGVVAPYYICFSLQEGTFTMYHKSTSTHSVKLGVDNYYYDLGVSAAGDGFYNSVNGPYMYCAPEIDQKLEGEGILTIRQVDQAQ